MANKQEKREHYRERIEAKRERLEERADKALERASNARRREEQIASAIPMGQPILVGHYSEKRHRRDIARIQKAAETQYAESEKAARLRSRANAVGSGGISADNPDAPTELRLKLEKMEQSREVMKAANRVVRKKKLADDEKVRLLVALGLQDATARRLLKPDCLGDIGYPAYALSNLGANIRRVRQRIVDLEREEALRETTDCRDIEGDGYSIVQDDLENRLRLSFARRLTKEEFRSVRADGFRWSREHQAFSRQLNCASRYAVQRAVKRILDIEVAFD